MLEKYFGPIPAGPKPEADDHGRAAAGWRRRSVILKEPTQPLYLEGYHKPDYRDPDDAVYDAIQDIFSNGRTSRLYRSLVRDQQIAAVGRGLQRISGRQVSRTLCVLCRAAAGPYAARRCATRFTRRSTS